VCVEIDDSEGTTVVLTIIGGDKNAYVGTPMLIFKNKARNYPLRGVPDNVEGACYITGPNGFIDGTVMKMYLESPRTWGHKDQHRVLWLDNASGHSFDGQDEIVDACNTDLNFFPPNSTHRLQACDSFVIKIFKNLWNTEYSIKLAELIQAQRFSEGRKNWSGKVERPPGSWYLKTAAKCVRELNKKTDKFGIGMVHKSMILTGTGVANDNEWRTENLSKENQLIIADFPQYFSGEKDPKAPYEEASDIDDSEGHPMELDSNVTADGNLYGSQLRRHFHSNELI
jgi:hypothetical protein